MSGGDVTAREARLAKVRERLRRYPRDMSYHEADMRLARLQEACDVLVLTWRCETCGWETTLPVPGFGGDGRFHYEDGKTPCGPLFARRDAASSHDRITAGRGRGRGKPPDSSSGSTPDPAHTSTGEDAMRISEKAQLALDDLIEVWKKETPSAVASQAAISRLTSAIDDIDALEEWVASYRGRCVHYHGGGTRCECGFLPNVEAGPGRDRPDTQP